MERDAETVPSETGEPAADPFVRRPAGCSGERSEQIATGADEGVWFYQTAKPTPGGEVERQIKRQQDRQSVQKKILIQSSKRAEPTETCAEENDSGDVTKKQIAQPASARILARKPNGGDQRSERDPAQPALIEWWETGGAK